MKKVFCILMAALLLTMSVSSAFAMKLFDQHWKPGEYTVELTDVDKAYYNSLYETALKNSEGTTVKADLAVYTYENVYLYYLDYLERHKGNSLDKLDFEDVPDFNYVIGMPDEDALLAQQALMISYHAVKEQYHVLDSQLIQYLPFFAYYVYDPQNPVWIIELKGYEQSVDNIMRIGIYAHDGSVQGVGNFIIEI